MEKITRFRYWNMFMLESLENWLEQQAEAGLILEDVRHGYSFTFRRERGATIAYHMDYRGYLPDGYLAELDRRHWTVKKISNRWLLLWQPYRGKRPKLYTDYDEDMAASLKISAVIMVILTAIVTVIMYLFAGTGFAILILIISGYNILRTVLYRMVLLERIRIYNDK